MELVPWKNVTDHDPELQRETLGDLLELSLERALTGAICDPGTLTPRRYRGPKGDREYESINEWSARACVIVVASRLGLHRKGEY